MGILERINDPSDLKKLNKKEMPALAKEIREFLIQSVSQTGGHLASNLGVVELTLAIHRVFDLPKDKVVWDVGHQTYVHKLLTGRKEAFSTLRQYGGISGFPKTSEDDRDIFNTGHSSNSISAALGLAAARDLSGGDESIIAVIGDGALTGGQAYEGLNNAGRMKRNFIIILNDNEMSISKNVGSIAKCLYHMRTAPSYRRMKYKVKNSIGRIPLIGKPLAGVIEKTRDSIKHFFSSGTFFEELGFTYFGIIDGNNQAEIEDALHFAKKVQGPVMLHIHTKKGNGYSFAEEKPDMFHGVGIFDPITGEAVNLPKNTASFSKILGNELAKIAETDEKVVAVTAAMPLGTGLSDFSKKHPKRFFDVGIAEGHAVTFCAGLAAGGYKPVFSVYSSFLQRGYDQLLEDVALQNLPVVVTIDRAGIVGEDGETHHGIYDLSYLLPMPNMAVLAPSSTGQFAQMLHYALTEHNGPIAIRYPKNAVSGYQINFEYRRAKVINQGNDITVVCVGTMLHQAIMGAKDSGKSVELIDIGTIKPLDKETLMASYHKTGKMMVIEDGSMIGGAGSYIEKELGIPVIKLGLTDGIISHGSIDELYRECKIDAKGIAEKIYENTP